eukprot:2042382-Heterocapsa_arctica.AAC.1
MENPAVGPLAFKDQALRKRCDPVGWQPQFRIHPQGTPNMGRDQVLCRGNPQRARLRSTCLWKIWRPGVLDHLHGVNIRLLFTGRQGHRVAGG